jgi:hypothetical protein
MPECVLRGQHDLLVFKAHARERLRTAAIEIAAVISAFPVITHNPETSCWTVCAALTANSGFDDPIWKITDNQL